MPNRITVVSGLIVNKQSQVLMALRRDNDKPFANMWELPGGKVQGDETERQALVRELREELGVQVVVGPLISTASFRWAERVNLLLFECVPTERPMRPLESQELDWVHLEEARDYRACLPSLYSWYDDIEALLSSGLAMGGNAVISD